MDNKTAGPEPLQPVTQTCPEPADAAFRSKGRAVAGLLALALSVAILAYLAFADAFTPQKATAFPSLHRGSEAAGIILPQGEIPLNSADVQALTALPGIGESKAAAIVEEREANGPYFYPQDLTIISGIGQGTVEKLREHINLN